MRSRKRRRLDQRRTTGFSSTLFCGFFACRAQRRTTSFTNPFLFGRICAAGKFFHGSIARLSTGKPLSALRPRSGYYGVLDLHIVPSWRQYQCLTRYFLRNLIFSVCVACTIPLVGLFELIRISNNASGIRKIMPEALFCLRLEKISCTIPS